MTTTHCRGCIGFVQRKERDLYGKLIYEPGDDCPGVTCPSCAEQAQRIAELEAATRRLVEAVVKASDSTDLSSCGFCRLARKLLDKALADPVLVALRRE